MMSVIINDLIFNLEVWLNIKGRSGQTTLLGAIFKVDVTCITPLLL
jgi:hypothetical protein